MSSLPENQLVSEIRALRPWHQNIQVTQEVDVASAFDESERERANNQNVSMIDARQRFMTKVKLMFPAGLTGKRFLDCACNAGGYCFWARELGAQSFGFDVRHHWIDQARLVLKHRTVAPVDQIRFEVCDLMELPSKNLQPADLTLFKGIFYHLADPILGLKIAAELTREVIWINTRRRFCDDDDSMYCSFEADSNPMSGVHSLSWMPTGPKVLTKMLYWLGFVDIRHVFSKPFEHNPEFGRMEMMAARTAGLLDDFARAEEAQPMGTEFVNAVVASHKTKTLL